LYRFSHVAKTGDIREFVIIEESGIAKGIRRIIAITGEEARQASMDANEADSKWEKIVSLTSSGEKEKGIKLFEVVRPSSHLSFSAFTSLVVFELNE